MHSLLEERQAITIQSCDGVMKSAGSAVKLLPPFPCDRGQGDSYLLHSALKD